MYHCTWQLEGLMKLISTFCDKNVEISFVLDMKELVHQTHRIVVVVEGEIWEVFCILIMIQIVA